jgi:hypothetical protein
VPTRRDPDTRHRHYRDDVARRAEREARRHIVPLTQRRLDDGIIDDTAIDLALRHWRRYGAALTRAELAEAIRIGIDRGLGTPELAERLCLWEREVERFRAELRAGRRETVAA